MDNSSWPNPNGAGDNRNNRRPFRLGRGRQNPSPIPINQPSGFDPSRSNSLTPIRNALGRGLPPASPSPTPTTASPIHTRPMDIDPQSASPLYNGSTPAEIRDQIFQYAMIEYTKTDPRSTYPESTGYTRPGYTGHLAVTVALLLTCRRVYLETYHLPAQNKEHVFWHERGPAHQERSEGMHGGQEQAYFEQLTEWQRPLVKELHLFTQLFWLEDGPFSRLAKEEFMQGIEKLKITVRRGDWWWNERNAPLAINPQRGNGGAVLMHQDRVAEKRGEVIPWTETEWGCAFGDLQALRELEMEFETSEDKVGELGIIVERATTWRFPLKDGKVLSTQGLASRTWKWRSPMCFWSEECPYCFGRAQCQGMDALCVEKRRLRGRGLGPECTVVSLRWRVANAAT